MVEQLPDGEVEFRMFRPAARRVCLTGDFTGWKKDALSMKQTADGWWICRLHLAPGTYQFQYLVDGERYLDYAAFGLDRGATGQWNSVVRVNPLPAVADREAEGACVGLPHAAFDARAGRPSRADPPTFSANGRNRAARRVPGVVRQSLEQRSMPDAPGSAIAVGAPDSRMARPA